MIHSGKTVSRADFYLVECGDVEDTVGGSSMSDLREDTSVFSTLVDEEAIDWYFSRARSSRERAEPRYVLAVHAGRAFLLDYDLDMDESTQNSMTYEPWSEVNVRV